MRTLLLATLVLATACAHSPYDELLAGNGLTFQLAENTTQLDLLNKLHTGDREGAIRTLQFEVDGRAILLREMLALSEQGRIDVDEEQRNLIVCHLHAIKRQRDTHGVVTRYPELAELADVALRGLPVCNKKPCAKKDALGEQARGHAASRCG